MKRKRVLFLLLLLLANLVACSAGHLGGKEIAFIQDGNLWTIDPDGANAFKAVKQDTPVVDFSWSPSHQIFVFRTLDSTFANSQAAKHLTINTITGQVTDNPSTVSTVSIDGGNAIPIMLSDPSLQFSNPVWNNTSTRLIYRQGQTGIQSSTKAFWWASQNDQPQGIAAKPLPSSSSRLSLSYIDSSAIGTTSQGIFSVSLTGTNLHYLVHETPRYPLPAAIERVMWQPQHTQPYFLYARAVSNTQTFTALPEVQLILHATNGREQVLTTCNCNQFAWAPDGNSILYSTGIQETLLNIKTLTSFSFPVEATSVPYWSPDGKYLLLDGTHSLQLVRISDHHQQTLLSDGMSTTNESFSIATTNALLSPVPNSLWASDSSGFVFLSHTRLSWLGHTLQSGKGLYTVSIDGQGQPTSVPAIVDKGNDTQVGWSYQDPNTSFLY